MASIEPISCPMITLNHSSVETHCRSLRGIGLLPYWWYQGQSKMFGNYSIPFMDTAGRWWYQVKPGLCWPVDFLEPINFKNTDLPFLKSFFGYQHIVEKTEEADSRLVINVIRDIAQYGTETVSSKRRNSIRKGLQCCELEVLHGYDSETFDECRQAWDELVVRTGWKKTAEKSDFDRTWSMIIDCPGYSILIGRDRENGKVGGFLITKIIGSTAYVDTIASRNDALKLNINDALMYTFVYSASRIPGVQKAHYAIKSHVDNLEKFKTGMGFEPFPYPARTRLRGPTRLAMMALFPSKYRRMIGEMRDA